MEQETIAKIIDTLKTEGIDLVVTLPEEPTSPLTETIRRDPYFTSVTVANENNGVALCAAASLGGRRCIFVTGIAGLLVGTWSLAQMGVLYGIPVLIMELAPHVAIIPGLVISITILGFNLIGDGLRDIFDPRQYET